MNFGRTASVLLTDQEVTAIEQGLRLLYRPISLHWDHMFSKFKEPRQIALVGFEVQDIVHLMKETGRVVKDDDGNVVVDGNGRPKTHKIKIESRVIKKINDEAIFPEDYNLEYDNLEPMDQCWIVSMGHKVG